MNYQNVQPKRVVEVGALDIGQGDDSANVTGVVRAKSIPPTMNLARHIAQTRVGQPDVGVL